MVRNTNATRQDELITEKVAAAMLGLSVATLQLWRSRRHLLPFVKIGGAVKYSRRAVEDFIEASTVEPKAAARENEGVSDTSADDTQGEGR